MYVDGCDGWVVGEQCEFVWYDVGEDYVCGVVGECGECCYCVDCVGVDYDCEVVGFYCCFFCGLQVD